MVTRIYAVVSDRRSKQIFDRNLDMHFLPKKERTIQHFPFIFSHWFGLNNVALIRVIWDDFISFFKIDKDIQRVASSHKSIPI